jgi:hypothetical protein
MSVLEAIRMRSSATEDRSTPVFLVEEPESFLHPSAQAEFGQVLNGLAEELHIQIIATTHRDFCAIGIEGAGTDCIEGLLPPTIKRNVYSAKHELVTALGSQDAKARNSAKNALKRALLEEFKSCAPSEKELHHFKSLFSSIGKAFH